MLSIKLMFAYTYTEFVMAHPVLVLVLGTGLHIILTLLFGYWASCHSNPAIYDLRIYLAHCSCFVCDNDRVVHGSYTELGYVLCSTLHLPTPSI